TVMQTGLSGVTWVVATYRQRLILKRILATPAHPAAFLGGLVGRYTLTSLFQMAVIMLVAVLAFHARIAGSLLTLGALIVLGTLVFVGMGFAISTIAKSPEAANLLGSAISFPMMFLGGTFWPKDFMPKAMQPVIGLLPLSPLVDVLRGVATGGDPLTSYLPGWAYLAARGAVSLSVAARRLRRARSAGSLPTATPGQRAEVSGNPRRVGAAHAADPAAAAGEDGAVLARPPGVRFSRRDIGRTHGDAAGLVPADGDRQL